MTIQGQHIDVKFNEVPEKMQMVDFIQWDRPKAITLLNSDKKAYRTHKVESEGGFFQSSPIMCLVSPVFDLLRHPSPQGVSGKREPWKIPCTNDG